MADRAYYKISLAGSHELGTDNPDQRISEDIRDYCRNIAEPDAGSDFARRHACSAF